MTADAVGGVWTYALELARGLGSANVATVLAVMGPAPSAAQRAEAAAIPGLALHHADYKLEWMDAPWADVDRAGRWLLALEREIQPGLIHLNGFAHASLPFTAPKIVIAHSCVLSWWSAVYGEPAPSEWSEYRSRVAAGLHAADLVIAPSRAMLAAIAEHYGRPTRAHVIPNGREPSQFRPAAKEPMVFTAGRLWDSAKNLKILEQIAPSLDWPVYAAGDGEIAPPVRHLGPLAPAEIRAWLARAAIFALPALYEPFGLSILEAAMSGCALVLGDIPSLRENWSGAALFASPRDPATFGAQIRRVIHDDRMRSRLQRVARVRSAQFTAARMTREYLDTYAAVLRRSQALTAFRS